MKLMKTLFTSFVLCGSLAAGSTFAEDKVVEQTTQAVVTTQTDSQVAPAMMGDKLNINIATASEIQKIPNWHWCEKKRKLLCNIVKNTVILLM